MQPVEAPQLLDRTLVVVDAQVDQRHRRAAHSRRRAPRRAGRRTAGRAGRRRRTARRRGSRAAVRRADCRHSSRRSWRARRPSRVDEDVPLRRVARPGAAACPVVAAAAREVAPLAARIHDAQLPLVPAGVGGGQPLDDLVGGEALAQQCQAVRPVARVRLGLRRDRTDLRLGPRDDRADGEELRLRRDAPLPALEVAGADRVGCDDGSAIGQRRQVELEQSRAGPAGRARRDLGPGERRLTSSAIRRAGRRRDGPARALPGAARRPTPSSTSASSSSSSPSTAISGTRRPVAPNQRSLTSFDRSAGLERSTFASGASSRSSSGVPVRIGNVP